MTSPNTKWLLDPVIPAAPAVPRLAHDSYEPLNQTGGSAERVERTDQYPSQYPSGTWLLGARAERERVREETLGARFARSDSEAPTIRPGLLHVAKRR